MFCPQVSLGQIGFRCQRSETVELSIYVFEVLHKEMNLKKVGNNIEESLQIELRGDVWGTVESDDGGPL